MHLGGIVGPERMRAAHHDVQIGHLQAACDADASAESASMLLKLKNQVNKLAKDIKKLGEGCEDLKMGIHDGELDAEEGVGELKNRIDKLEEQAVAIKDAFKPLDLKDTA